MYMAEVSPQPSSCTLKYSWPGPVTLKLSWYQYWAFELLSL
jgi:hypothetical protein